MPAVARKATTDYHDQETVTAARPGARPSGKAAPGRRWHDSGPAPRGKSTPAAPARTRRSRQSEDVGDLLLYFGHGDAQREAKLRAQMEAQREARRRARRRHRPFRLTPAASVIIVAPLLLLASLLWLRSSALALARHDSRLQEQITTARFDLERTRKEIATVSASPHIESWAAERSWQRAAQNDFDRVPGAEKTTAAASVE